MTKSNYYLVRKSIGILEFFFWRKLHILHQKV